MKASPSSHYAEAINFALATPSHQSREFYSARLYLFAQQAPANRPQFTGKTYLEAYERVPGGIVFLNWWAPANRAGVRAFFQGLAERASGPVSPRPYRLGQACDGTIGSSVLHAYKVACDALGLDADALHRKAYTTPGDDPPNWPECRKHAEWQGGVVWPSRWDKAAVDALAESLTEINHHSLRSEFMDAV